MASLRRTIRAVAQASALFALAAGVEACSRPALTRDGQVVFTPAGGRRGASVLTANGVEFIDAAEVPKPNVRRSPYEPWTPATGFLLPKDGVWRATSKPVAISGPGLAVVIRSSDVLIPSWGGEVLVRIDVIAPRDAFPHAHASVREPRRIALVIDGYTSETVHHARTVLDNLGALDRIVVIDAQGARLVVPPLPGSDHTLLDGAIARVVGRPSSSKERGSRDLPKALALARRFLTGYASDSAPVAAARQVIVLTDGIGVARGELRLASEIASLKRSSVRVSALGMTSSLGPAHLVPFEHEGFVGTSVDKRDELLEKLVPPPGDVVLEDVELTFSSVPAPVRVLEVSGGFTALSLDHDRLALGDLYAGEARTEVARVVMPVWVPGEPLEFTVTARYRDAATGAWFAANSTILGRYDDDVERIARARHGDVIAYASALSMVRRLGRIFQGSRTDHLGGLRPIVAMQADSLARLSRETGDGALGVQADVLRALLGVVDD
ncbi:MAG: VWA domain-containing protein [Polyangiaceae bacterium]|nr:VWA domain-containing protein [Polyangiaceae bacterium]